uniref:Uncharacterized protein n=1 Tax=Oryza rufipogon TaxID=4529 RepID=A0A0E0Q3Z6_ORYRU
MLPHHAAPTSPHRGFEAAMPFSAKSTRRPLDGNWQVINGHHNSQAPEEVSTMEEGSEDQSS